MTFRTSETTTSMRKNKVTGHSFVLDFVIDVIKFFLFYLINKNTAPLYFHDHIAFPKVFMYIFFLRLNSELK